jgi:hypothetical protein
MATNTYVALDKVTVGTAVASVTFSSIPATYTDLIIVTNVGYSAANYYTCLQFNADTASNYSATFLAGTGSSAVSNRTTSATFIADGNNIAGATTILDTVIFHIQNYANATTFKTVLVRKTSNGGSYPGTEAAVGLWRKTPETINSIKLFSSSAGNFAVGSTFSLYGIAASSVGAKATGGYVTSDSLYYYHTFPASGTFTPASTLSCDVLLVAGGGGGGTQYGGGGGGGGLMYGTGLSLSTAQTVTIGAGGAGIASGSFGAGTNGSNSVFGSYTANGGGGGAYWQSNVGRNGSNGGSGGGGSMGSTAGTATTGGSATQTSSSPMTGYGNAGANGYRGTGATAYKPGGGGGAGAAGTAITANNTAENCSGGIGLTYSISGTSATYAGGGGGGGSIGGTGGSGGGGNGTDGTNNITGTAGTTNTGGGGGGGNGDATNTGSFAGGSGIVIVRYLKA